VKFVAALVAAAAAFLIVELSQGALHFGDQKRENACAQHAPYQGGGIDGVLQRIALDGLNGAACELHTTREELVLSLRASPSHRRWSDETIQRAVRAGLVRAIDDAERRGDVPSLVAPLLRRAAEQAPVKTLIEGRFDLGSLLDSLF